MKTMRRLLKPEPEVDILFDAPLRGWPLERKELMKNKTAKSDSLEKKRKVDRVRKSSS